MENQERRFKMKRITIEEQKMIKGGITYTRTCTGEDYAYHIPHSVTIKGSGDTKTEAKDAFNASLIRHKTSTTYYNSSHSQNPL